MQLANVWTRALLAALCLTPTLTAAQVPGDIERVSVSTLGAQGDSASVEPAVSHDGRFVAFQSMASTLVPGDTNFARDIFVRDRQTNVTVRVSVSSAGVQGDFHSYEPAISGDGRYVVFASQAKNLVPGDTNSSQDVFMHDLQTSTTTRVSMAPGGVQPLFHCVGASISADGRFVSFSSGSPNLVPGDTNGFSDIFVRDMQGTSILRVSVSSSGVQADGQCSRSVLSADGRFVAFDSQAKSLVPGDLANHSDVFVHAIPTGLTTRVSQSSTGTLGNSFSEFASISADGRFVAFHSRASTLVPGDANATDDVFLHDRQDATTSLISKDSGGVFGQLGSTHPSISPDGRFVAYTSWSSNLVPGDVGGKTDCFVYDRLTAITRRVNLGAGGVEANSHSRSATLAGDARRIVFESEASNLVAGDTNSSTDIFIREFQDAAGCPQLATYCTSKPTSIPGCLPGIDFSGSPSASAGSGFDVLAGPTPGGLPGLFLYTTKGYAAVPISNAFGFLCLTPGAGMFRIASQSGGGSSGTCSGQYSVDFNQYAATQVIDVNLVAGAAVDVQAWYRDPTNPGGANLTNAGRFLLCP